MGNQPLTVYFYPRDNNPYQHLLSDALEQNGITVTFLSSKQMLKSLLSLKLALPRGSIFHLHWITTNLSKRILLVLFLIKCRVTKTPVVWTVHNLVPHETRYKWFEVLFRTYLAKFLVDSIIVHGMEAKDIVSEQFRTEDEKITIMRHGNYLMQYQSPIENHVEALRKKFGFAEDANVLLFFGQIKPYKGVMSLVNAFQKSKHAANDHLLIVGMPDSNDLSNAIKKLASTDPACHIELSFIEESEVSAYFALANVCVFPFKEVLTSGSIVLAAGFGKAIIAPEIGVIPEYLSEGNYLYDGSLVNLIDTINTVLDEDRDVIRVVGERNKQYVESLTWSQSADVLELVYKSFSS